MYNSKYLKTQALICIKVFLFSKLKGVRLHALAISWIRPSVYGMDLWKKKGMLVTNITMRDVHNSYLFAY